jgi:cobalt-zinc-cadmium efflux system membrane fusion protein
LTIHLNHPLQKLGNGCVLLLLIGLAAWGHLNHWTLPRFAEVPERIQTASRASLEGTLARTLAGKSPADGDQADAPQTVAAGEDPLPPLVTFRSSEAAQKAGLRLEAAGEQELDDCVDANGVVAYDETRLARLSARVAGIAWRVEKQLGDHVRKGEVLAILDALEVGKAKAEFLEAMVALDVKSQHLRSLEKISSSVAERQLREAAARVREARIRRFNAQQTLINLGLPLPATIDDHMTDEELSRSIHFLGIPEAIVSDIEPEAATANLIPLVAPFDGVVIERAIVTGEVVQTARPQFVVADVSRMWLKLNVKKSDAVRLALDQTIWFSADGVPGELECILTWIGTEVDEKTRTVQVRAVTDNPLVASPSQGRAGQRLLRAHTFGTARIRVREERRAVVVPGSAVQWNGTNHVVFIPQTDGKSFLARVVTPGVSRDGTTEIVRGIQRGEMVVAAGSHLLKSEMGRQQTADLRP